MRLLWYVALGGAGGSVLRLLVSAFVQGHGGGDFPLGTLIINVTGSLLLGFLLRYALDTTAITPEWRALLTTGFCGGYTTFSTFSYETVALIENGDWRRAAIYATLSFVLALAGTAMGIVAARELIQLRRGF
jgi:CrcB protein